MPVCLLPRLSPNPSVTRCSWPEDCDCGMCVPTWTRRRGKSRRYSEPVTLADALTREDPAARPSMVAQHCACLTILTSAVSRVTAGEEPDDLAIPS